jgi:putative ABC transport system permease protein
LERYWQILSVSLEAVFLNKSRSILTALGIIFGVAAVIAMMAIGNGARQEILAQMKMVGVNNIVILPENSGTAKNQETSTTEQQQKEKSLQKKFVPGLTLQDAENIRNVLPTVTHISPEVQYKTQTSRNGRKMQATLTGVTSSFFSIFNLAVRHGNLFTEKQALSAEPVCVIGPEVAAQLFPDEDPLGKQLKAGNIWLQVIGVIRGLRVSKKAEDMGISDYNHSIFTPLKTILLRYKDRSLINQAALVGGGGQIMVTGGSVTVFDNGNSSSNEAGNDQLDKIVVQVHSSSQLLPTAKVIRKILLRRHRQTQNFTIKIPELLLKQEQKTKDIFNIVLGAIAGISLLVGGIGIMNIMLASVMERIREIGIRRATGATQKDIIFQFLAESALISISGGVLGVFLGVVMAKVITLSTGILTIVSFWSILLAFGVAAAVGIVFGYLPAKKAALKDPVESLRHD